MFGKPATNLFGSTPNTSFGANTFGTPNNTGFGGGATFGTSPFGATNQPPSTGLFGSTSNPLGGGSLFGNTSMSFGTSTNNTAFSFGGGTGMQSAPQSTSLFGQTSGSTTGSLFGQPAQQTTGFGQPASGAMNLFGGGAGATAANPVGFLGPQPIGTTVKFAPVPGTDVMVKSGSTVNISTRMQCITGMKEYENKSLEELRYEDYQANRKSGSTLGSGLGGGFLNASQQQQQQQQSQASGFSMFGAQNKPAFSSFGTSAAATGGANLFGSTNLSQAKPLFGTGSTAATTTTMASSGFGSLASGTLFGGNKSTGGLFGSTATTTQSTGFFGNAQPQASIGGFGLGTQNTTLSTNQNTGGLFGAKPLGFAQTATTTSAFAFGTSQATQSGLGGAFGGGLFNKPAASAAPGFGLGTQNTSLGFGPFGQQTSLGSSSGFGSFGATNTANSLFSNQQKPAGTLFGNSGTTAPMVSTNSGFGQGTGLGGTSLTGGLGMAGTGGLGTGCFGMTNTGLLGAQQPQQLQQQQQPSADFLAIMEQQKQLQQHISALNSSPYGDNPLFKNLVGSADSSRQSELLKPTNPAAQQALLSGQVRYKQSHEKATLRTAPLPIKSEKSLLFDCLEDDNHSGLQNPEETFTPRRNFKYLNVSTILQQQQMFNSSKERRSARQATSLDGAAAKSPTVDSEFGKSALESLRLKSRADLEDSKLDGDPLDNTMNELLPRMAKQQQQQQQQQQQGIPSIKEGTRQEEEGPPAALKSSRHPAGVVLTRLGYFTLPTLEEMAATTDDNGTCVVTDLVIGREGYGNVLFPGETNVTNLNLDELVHFRRKEIEIYPDSSTKHAHGQGLNKKAQVTLDMVYPVDKATKEPITDYNRLVSMGFVETLERRCSKMNAKFVEYRPETGSYVFIVDHFSKYGVLDESDEEETQQGAVKTGSVPTNEIKKQPPSALKKVASASDRDKQQPFTPVKPKKQAAFAVPDDDTMDFADDPVRERYLRGVKVTPHPRAGPKGDDTSAMEEDDDDDDFASDRVIKDDGDMKHSGLDESSDLHPLKSPTYEGLGNVSAHRVQLQKASFFGSSNMEVDDDDDDLIVAGSGKGRGGIKVDREESLIKDLSFTPKRKSGILQSSSLSMVSDDFVVKQLPSSTSTSSHQSLVDEARPPSRPPLVPFKSDHPVLASGMTEEDIRALADDRSSRVEEWKVEVVPYERSLMYGKQRLHWDLGLYHGLSSRVGWGFSGVEEDCPGWTVAHVGPPMWTSMEAETEKSGGFCLGSKLFSNVDDSLCIKLERILPPAYGSEKPSIKEMLAECLQAELDHCRAECQWTEVGGDSVPDAFSVECPLFTFSREAQSLLSDVNEKLEKFSSLSEWSRKMSSVWRLCDALWGELKEGEECHDKDDYYCHSLRKGRLTAWLSREAEPKIEQEVSILEGDNTEGHVTFTQMTGFQVRRAVQSAMDVGDARLALLLAQAAGPEDVRVALRKQLEIWGDSKMDCYMSESRLATYALLSGVLFVRTNKGEINCCRSLDWKRCFGLHLWYACPATCTITDALAEYEDSYRGETAHGRYCSAPNPGYMEDRGMDEDSGIADAAYRLLGLFCGRRTPLHSVLDPAAFGEDPLDYSYSWHLMKLLGSLGYSRIGNYHASSVCHNYASQLEALGLWHWAAFVLMHIPHPTSRTDAVKKLITRNVSLLIRKETKPTDARKRKTMEDGEDEGEDRKGEKDEDGDIEEQNKMITGERSHVEEGVEGSDDGEDDTGDDEEKEEDLQCLLSDKEKFLVDKLSIPVEWIHEAKAMRAESEGLVVPRALHLLKARRFALYHDLVVREMAPSFVANGDLRSLRRWFVRMERAAGWKEAGRGGGGRYERGGGTYMEYLRLIDVADRIEAMDEEKDKVINYDEERRELMKEVEKLVRLLGSKIKGLPDVKAIDRYAQQVMSQTLLRGILKLLSVDQGSHDENHKYAMSLLEIVENLPIPDEIAEEGHERISHEYLKNLILRCIEQL